MDYMTPSTFTVTSTNPALTQHLEVDEMRAGKRNGIIYIVHLVTKSGADELNRARFAKVNITDKVKISYYTEGQEPYLNPDITAQMWKDGLTGQTPEEGFQTILYLCALSADILPV